jgi:hypothetical protein
MKADLIIPHQAKTTIIQVKNELVISNGLQLKEIEKYHQKHPQISMNEAAIQWIDKNAAAFRKKHPLSL